MRDPVFLKNIGQPDMDGFKATGNGFSKQTHLLITDKSTTKEENTEH